MKNPEIFLTVLNYMIEIITFCEFFKFNFSVSLKKIVETVPKIVLSGKVKKIG